MSGRRDVPHAYTDLMNETIGSKRQYDMFNQPSDLESDFEGNQFRKASAKRDSDVRKLLEEEQRKKEEMR